MSRRHIRTAENKNKVEKRHRQSEKKRMQNQPLKTRARTMVRRVRAAVLAGDFEAADAALPSAFSALDGAAQKGALHRNNAARRKSRLAHAIAKARQSAPPQAEQTS